MNQLTDGGRESWSIWFGWSSDLDNGLWKQGRNAPKGDWVLQILHQKTHNWAAQSDSATDADHLAVSAFMQGWSVKVYVSSQQGASPHSASLPSSSLIAEAKAWPTCDRVLGGRIHVWRHWSAEIRPLWKDFFFLFFKVILLLLSESGGF